ncbi:hypothetical protein LSG31_22070 [Fodinisporobacter ferrooxydans]|uniref:Toxin n=1 Tax=Fodinisporobacter ferrooxydans TaxID=2901836 RepID=A0ABY4CRN6_9BACL|nr:hypothetical protein LSG31_22070 [Alicyclobacillaceae bacterium MYW30-H2]
MASIEEINQFLSFAREYKAKNKLDFIKGPQEKYLLGELGISIKDAFAMLDLLTFENYYRGPSPDHAKPNQQVWEFGIEEVPADIYIKLTIRKTRNDLLFMSFHFAERPIVYPYKGKLKTTNEF